MNIPTIHELRKKGYRVRISHHRFVSTDNGDVVRLVRLTKKDKKQRLYNYIHHKGGLTEITITPPLDETTVFRGKELDSCSQARCSLKDPFNRRLGIRICLTRLKGQGLF